MSYRAFGVRRIAGALGAELAGVDLSEPLGSWRSLALRSASCCQLHLRNRSLLSEAMAVCPKSIIRGPKGLMIELVPRWICA